MQDTKISSNQDPYQQHGGGEAFFLHDSTVKEALLPSVKQQMPALPRKTELDINICNETGSISSPDSVTFFSNQAIPPPASPLNHWWEGPFGGKPVFPLKQMASPASPTQSDVTFEGGVACNDNADDSCADSTPKACLATDGIFSSFNEKSSDRTTGFSETSGLHPLPSAITNCFLKREKGNNNRWSEEEGKMIIGSDIFSTILPTSIDEAGLQKRISELRVALQASESARLENEKETEALRNYLAEVEAAAAGLQSRVQDLEQIISLSLKKEKREVDKLRGTLAIDLSKEVRNHSAIAAQAVAAARKSTMELDKVKRHASALIKAQEDEIQRLNMEAAECQKLCHAKTLQIQELKSQIERMEDESKQKLKIAENAHKASHEENKNLLEQVEEAKIEAQSKASQYSQLMEAFDFTKNEAERNLEESENEKKELKSHSQWLEQRVAELQNWEVSAATGIHYDNELCKRILSEGKKILEGEHVEWQEKSDALSCHLSEASIQKSHLPKSYSPLDKKEKHNKFYTKGDTLLANSGCLNPQNNVPCTGQGNNKPFGKAKQNAECSFSDDNRSVIRSLEEAEGSKREDISLILRDNLLAAAHIEILKLKEINQCLVIACRNKFKLSKYGRKLKKEDGHVNELGAS